MFALFMHTHINTDRFERCRLAKQVCRMSRGILLFRSTPDLGATSMDSPRRPFWGEFMHMDMAPKSGVDRNSRISRDILQTCLASRQHSNMSAAAPLRSQGRHSICEDVCSGSRGKSRVQARLRGFLQRFAREVMGWRAFGRMSAAVCLRRRSPWMGTLIRRRSKQ